MLDRRTFIASCGLGIMGTILVGCGNTGDGVVPGKSSTDASAQSSLSGSITAVGSTALQPLVEAAAETFMSNNSGVQISVQGGGSGQGITQIAQGSIQIGNSDVFAEDKLKDQSQLDSLVDNKVAVVGMGPVVNPEVSVTNVTKQQLKDIFFGKITNWKDVGGQDLEITVINRASGSGTRATFEAAVFGGESAPESFKPQEQDSTGAVTKMVAQTPGAISYVSFYFFNNGVNPLSVDGVEPKPENVHTNDWPIWSYEHMYTQKNPDQVTSAFIEYMLSDEVQKGVAAEMGYIAISDMAVEKNANGDVTKL